VGDNRRCLVLVVEDDPSIAEFVEAALTDEGYEVRVTPSGEEGLQQAAKERPSAVLLDMTLPGMRGSAFLAQLRRAYPSDIPVVLMTAAREEPAQAELAVQGLLLKPFDLSRLVQEVERVTEGKCRPGAA